MGFWKEAFSDNGNASSSRVLTALHSLGALALMANFSYHNHGAIPDLGTIAALGGFAVMPYSVNRASVAWENSKKPVASGDLPQQAG